MLADPIMMYSSSTAKCHVSNPGGNHVIKITVKQQETDISKLTMRAPCMDKIEVYSRKAYFFLCHILGAYFLSSFCMQQKILMVA